MTLLRLWNLERKRERRSSLPCRRACTAGQITKLSHPCHQEKHIIHRQFIERCFESSSLPSSRILAHNTRFSHDLFHLDRQSIHAVLQHITSCTTAAAAPPPHKTSQPLFSRVDEGDLPAHTTALFPPTCTLNHHNGRVYISFHFPREQHNLLPGKYERCISPLLFSLTAFTLAFRLSPLSPTAHNELSDASQSASSPRQAKADAGLCSHLSLSGEVISSRVVICATETLSHSLPGPHSRYHPLTPSLSSIYHPATPPIHSILTSHNSLILPIALHHHRFLFSRCIHAVASRHSTTTPSSAAPCLHPTDLSCHSPHSNHFPASSKQETQKPASPGHRNALAHPPLRPCSAPIRPDGNPLLIPTLPPPRSQHSR